LNLSSFPSSILFSLCHHRPFRSSPKHSFSEPTHLGKPWPRFVKLATGYVALWHWHFLSLECTEHRTQQVPLFQSSLIGAAKIRNMS
jgi:hypothetical protein